MIRPALESDLPAILAIYGPYILHSTATFEYEVPSLPAFTDRFRGITAQFPWLVWEENGTILGYAYASAPYTRPAYAWCAEPSVYLCPQARGSGIGAALYAALTHMQNLLLPGSATWAIQMRLSEALCVLAFFTPAAIPGLSLGCLLFNLTFAAALPLDFIIGTAATALATAVMWWGRNWTVKGYPLLGMLMPALFNALLVGWELTVYIGGGFWINGLYVAIGEAAVLLSAGSVLYYVLKKRGLDKKLFR